ncbi:MAG: hypothetical protein N3F63_01090 [Thermoplasmata archaeon]|nr:hypothetical protein [Thermoplasmata archaeon]
MGSREAIAIIRNYLIEYAGPMGGFVLKKAMNDMGKDEASFPADHLPALVERALNNAVYDPKTREELKKRIMSELKNVM